MAFSTPNPRGFPKRSSTEQAAENAAIFGIQPTKPHWSYNPDLDTRPKVINRRERIEKARVAEGIPQFIMRTTHRRA